MKKERQALFNKAISQIPCNPKRAEQQRKRIVRLNKALPEQEKWRKLAKDDRAIEFTL